jgi:hypothetical protein
MGTLISISSPQNQLRQNRTLLLSIGGISTVAGLLLWSATPFLLNNKSDRLQIALRYLSLASTLFCGVAACVSGYQLQRITPLIKALETAEQSDFLTQLASSQYVQQQQWQQLATSEVETLQRPLHYETPPSVSPAVSTSAPQLPTSESLEAPEVEDFQNFRSLYKAVSMLQQQGVSDTEIIETALQMGGRRFTEGKQALETLLQLGVQQEW